jgi:hypothetical protein
MSTKKQLRRERQEQDRKREEASKRNPVPTLLLSIAAILLVVGVIGYFLRGDREPPPWPGAVWSEAHQHWH